MSGPFQHYVQKSYLDRWRGPEGLFLFDKTIRKFERKQSARSILGMENMQALEMEEAFDTAEKHVGHTDKENEITDPNDIRIFAEWIALHLVRNGLNAPSLGSRDYTAAVRAIAANLANHHFAYFLVFRENHLITGDNPVIQINDQASQSLLMAPLSPKKCVFFAVQDVGVPIGFSPATINWYVYQAATRYCVSFDANLHIEDPIGMIVFDDRD